MTEYIHMDYAPTEDCSNPDTYGEICVKCNACGRFNKPTPKPLQTANYGQGEGVKK